MLAAHAIADCFERVTILERFGNPPDLASSAPAARRGVPQSRCLHLLMAAGAAAFDELMPGWREELVALGAHPFDASADAALRFSAGWLPRSPSGITTYACSRALLENVLRRGLAGKSRVHLREGQKVVGLLSSPRGERVIGVRMADRRGVGTSTLLADLVVDASGAFSTLPHWIARLSSGLGSQLNKTVVASGTQYVSRWFRIEPEVAPDWHCLSIAPAVSTALRSAMMLRAEGNRWGVVVLAPAGEPLPADDRAFLDFISCLGDRRAPTGPRRGAPRVPDPSFWPHLQSHDALRSPHGLARGFGRYRRLGMHARSILWARYDGNRARRGASEDVFEKRQGSIWLRDFRRSWRHSMPNLG